ncbi:MAG: hypothetical protein AB1730_01345 [Myxococcota bacterium]
MSGFEQEFDGRVRVRTVPHLAPEAKAAVERFGWSSHGLVITRGGRVVYTASDHRANAFDANVAVRKVLGLPLQCP